MSKAQILDHVWRYDFGGDASVVETYISYLRKKVDAGEDTAPLIHTVRGFGYAIRDPRSADMSLRIRLTAISVLLVALGLTAAAVATHRYIESFMIDRLDQQLAVAATPNPGGLESLPGGSYAAFIGRKRPGAGDGHPEAPPTASSHACEKAPDGYSSSGGYRFRHGTSPFGQGRTSPACAAGWWWQRRCAT